MAPPTSADQTILLTGVTGFLGRHILWSLLRRPDVRAVYCLMRPDASSGVERRLRRLLGPDVGSLPADAPGRCHAVVGDVVDEDVCADRAVRQRLLGEVDRVIHCAATVKFDTPLAEARRINVGGTRNVLGFANELHARGRLRRVDHFSTAYVAGRRSGLMSEQQLAATQFNNTYEQTKCEAEALVRQTQQALPITIFRPSIVVGDSKTGYTSNFKVLYWPLKILSRGLAFVVPADRNGVVDVVPIDHVVQAFEVLSSAPASLGQCFHLAAGPDGQSSFGELLRMAAKFFGVRVPVIIPARLSYALVRPFLYSVYWGKRRALLRLGEFYFPYFAYRASFDTAAVSGHLQRAGMTTPAVADYFRAVLQYCVDTDWGKKR